MFIFLALTILPLVLSQEIQPIGDFQNNGGFGSQNGFSSGINSGLGSSPFGNQNQMTYEAKGRLMCGLSFADKVRVVMFDYNNRTTYTYGEAVTDVIGSFTIRGTSQNNFGNSNGMMPYLSISHNCNADGRSEFRRVTVRLPSSYTNAGSLVTKTFDLGKNLKIADFYLSEICSLS
ncbi:hypothetical protein WR25_09017 isoform B [Diploscapter pachys]|uniref:ZP domain-containing protein n=1 Tax=Diploscapter pachys TaxID=2018661 RepID=A0A2A2M1E6_9BILA|nr:hypothetical protein WR25_09017 isoform B [Diploscapter pachys]